jgi:endonuclease III
MKDGAEYAKRIARLFKKLRRGEKAVDFGQPTDPTEQLITSILSVNTTSEQGRKALRRLRDRMVDYNEIRVSSPAEITGAVKDLIPSSTERAKKLVNTLNALFHTEHQVDLSCLKSMGIRDAKRYLEDLGDVEPYVVASVILWSLGGHAIPVSNPLLKSLRDSDLVAPDCDVAVVQSFLERHVAAADAKQFCHVMERFAGSHVDAGSATSATRSPGRRKKTRKKEPAKKRPARSSAARRKKASRRG